MASTVTLEPFDKQFTCEDDETVLAAGLRQGYNLCYGCKHGGFGSLHVRADGDDRRGARSLNPPGNARTRHQL